jgi:hypothetical protein
MMKIGTTIKVNNNFFTAIISNETRKGDSDARNEKDFKTYE